MFDAQFDRFKAPTDLLGRVLLSAIFIIAGYSKIGGYAGTAGYMESMGIPGALLPLVILTELGGGIAILLGLFTRLAAIPLLAMTAMIQFTYFYHSEHYFWAFVLLLFIVRGPGSWSVDHWLRRHFG